MGTTRLACKSFIASNCSRVVGTSPSWGSWLDKKSDRAVFTRPGRIALIVIPFYANSSANDPVKPRTAALEAEYGANWRNGCRAAFEDVLIIRPYPEFARIM